jgi:hypothetical protein
LGPHKYGRYLHILTPVTSEEQAPPWEGITGRVKHLQKQETNKMMTEMKRSNAAMNQRIDENVEANRNAVEANKTQLGDVQQQLKSIKKMLQAVLDKKQ